MNSISTPSKYSHKQVIVIRRDLNMRKGKIGAQVAHASVGALFAREKARIDRFNGNGNIVSWRLDDEQLKWFLELSTKIVVGVNSEDELLDIYHKAKNACLPCVLIKDKGFTEFNGQETLTAVGIGPGRRDEIDLITSHLPLM